MKYPGKVRCLVATVLVAATGGGATAPVWEELPGLPEGLAGHAVAMNETSLVVAGGTYWKDQNKRWSDTVFALSEDDRTWRRVGRLPQPLGYAGFVSGPGGLWLLGGHNADGARADVVRYDESGACGVVATLPAAWRFVRGARLQSGDYFVVRRESPHEDWAGAFLRRNAGDDRMDELAPVPNGAWVLPAVAAAGGRIVLAGGAARDETTGGIVNQSTILTFEPRRGTWRNSGNLPIALRGMGAATLGPRRVYLAGGFGDAEGFVDRAWIFDVVSGELTEAPALPLAVMPELLRAGAHVYLIGGEDAPRRRSARVFRAPIQSLTGNYEHELP